MTYFKFYDIPVAFYLDEIALKKAFYAKSKEFHPDFHTLSDDAAQENALEMASLNTQAYKVLSNFDSRMEYILKEKGILEEEGQAKLPQDFLMEMMELNELIMELEFDFDENIFRKAKNELQNIENELFNEVEALLKNYNDDSDNEEILKKIKIFYLKNKYLLRIQKSISTFAPH
jgi:molecular chaperone HscB